MNWQVVVHRCGETIDIGTVSEDSEANARCAALSKYGISEEEAEEGVLRKGIYVCDDFDVRPA